MTDAGMPSVSDPGYRLVAAAVAADVKVTAVPGPSAVLTALALSGLPVDRFTFEGFLPRKTGDRARQLATVAAEPRTMVFFEAPHRIAETLAAMALAFGADRPAAVCRELTKTYEEIKRGPLGELAQWAADGVRGEITVVVAGAPSAAPAELTPAELARRVAVREEAGERRKEAIAAVAAELALPKREVFDAVVAAKNTPALPGLKAAGAGRDGGAYLGVKAPVNARRAEALAVVFGQDPPFRIGIPNPRPSLHKRGIGRGDPGISWDGKTQPGERPAGAGRLL